VVRILVSEDSPASTFSKLIRQLMRDGSWSRTWTSVQIDPRNANTHYLSDLLEQLKRSLKLEDDPAADTGTVTVGSNIHANNVDISKVEVNLQEVESVSRWRKRLEHVADGIEDRLQTQRICLIFLNSHTYDESTLSQIRSGLWDERLAAMVDAGLLLVDISDSARCGPDWPPDPDLVLELPERFDDGSRADAQADLADIALREGIADAENTAEMFAMTLLQSSDKVRDLYANLARLQATQAGSTIRSGPA